jgi:hypothetical protein
VAHDEGERIVDLVGDPRDELAERSHLRRLDELGLGRLKLRVGGTELDMAALESELRLCALAARVVELQEDAPVRKMDPLNGLNRKSTAPEP